MGQTCRSCEIRWDDHERAITKKKWEHSGITQHYEQCDKTFNKENFNVITTMQGKNKKKLVFDLKVWEALEIQRHNSGPGRGLNLDYGAYVKTDAWKPVFHHMEKSRKKRGAGDQPSLGS